MDYQIILGFIFLNLFMIVGAFDLFYFHIWRYRLHTRPESRNEHKLHMLFAFIMVPLAFFLYYQNSTGLALWAAVFFVAAALATEMLYVFSEGDSRASLGGLSTGEYSMHVAATILKVASFAFMFASKPLSAWSLSAQAAAEGYGWMGEMTALQVMIGSFIVGVLHIVLLDRKIASVSCRTICDVVGCKRFQCCAG